MARCFALVLALLMLSANTALAAVTSATASPNVIRVNAQGSALANIRWTVDVTTSMAATLVSPSGTISGGPSVETPGRQLQKSITTLGATTHRFRERIRISAAAIQALRAGSAVTYSRSWSDGGAPLVVTLTMELTSGGELSIRAVDLKFGNDARLARVARGEALTAVAKITSAGRGRFEGVWQISGPAGQSTTAFRPFSRVRQTLAGPRTSIFESPLLPTDRPGTYFVRLLPAPDASDVTASIFPTLRYDVQPQSGSATLALNAPKAGARISPATRFSWGAAPQAEVYRVEFLSGGSVGQAVGNRIAAVDIAAPNTATNLRAFTIARLARQGARHWRVLAYSKDGRLIASSAPRRIDGSGN